MRGTIHWVSAAHAVDAEVRLYDRLFEDSDVADDPTESLNASSLEVLKKCKLEPSIAELAPGERVQLERLGYFVTDSEEHSAERIVVEPDHHPQGWLGQDRGARVAVVVKAHELPLTGS